MKIVQAAVLVLVGALGAMLFVKMQRSPEPQTPVTQAVAQPVPAAIPAEEPPPAEPAPSQTTKKHVSRTLTASRQNSEPMSSPVNSQPVVQDTQPAAPVQSSAPPPPAPVVEAPRQAEPPAPPPPPPPRQATLTEGTMLQVRLLDALSSDRNHPGDTFTATLDQPLVVDGFVLAERGARVEGKIIESQQAGRVKGLASIGLELTRLNLSDGQHVEISTDNYTKMGPESKKQDAAKIGGGAALGAIIGAIAGGGKGAAIGAGVGGAAGTGTVVATRGKPAVLPSETRLSFRLNSSVTITERRRRS